MTTVKLSIEQLEQMLEYAKNRVKHGDMKKHFIVSVKEHPSGKAFIEFEQPSQWAECNSIYHRYDSAE